MGPDAIALPWDLRFDPKARSLVVAETGARVPLNRALVSDILSGGVFCLAVALKGIVARLRRPRAELAAGPHAPRPWYLIWAAAVWAGRRIGPLEGSAAARIYFQDTTRGDPPAGLRESALNGGCTDLSKSRVADAFEAVFGYPLKLDPRVWTGPAVEKGEENGAHDGRVVECPCEPVPGKVYQRLVDNRRGEVVEDLRTPCVGGRPVLVFIKRRPIAARFANFNTGVELTEPEAVYSAEEIERLSALAAALKLDWGGLDVLRDRDSGRLYVVDVNKTDMGPPLALPLKRKLLATARLAEALEALLRAREARA